MSKTEYIDLMTLKNRPELSCSLFKYWIRDGKVVLVLCREEEINRVFQTLHVQASDNMFILGKHP